MPQLRESSHFVISIQMLTRRTPKFIPDASSVATRKASNVPERKGMLVEIQLGRIEHGCRDEKT